MGNSHFISSILLISYFSVILCRPFSLNAYDRFGNSSVDLGFLSAQQIYSVDTDLFEFDFYQTKEDGENSLAQKKIYLTFRMGLGSSAHLGESSQISIGVKPNKIPVVFLFISESHRKSPLKKEYAKPYDTFINTINLLYMPYQPMERKIIFFIGGGFGRLEWEKYERSDDPDWRQNPVAIVKGMVSNLELGLHLKLIRKLGFYAEGKYIYAEKKKNGESLIDISSSAWMVGLTLNFSFFDNS